MNTILQSSIALVIGLALSQSAVARSGGGGGRNGGGGGARGGGGHFSAPVAARSFSGGGRSFNGGGRAFGGGGQSFAARSMGGSSFRAPAQSFAQPTRSFSTAGFRGSSGVAAGPRRSIVAPTRSFNSAPTVAFGGHESRGGDRTFGGGFSRLPQDVARGWDRGHGHYWNHHRYGWGGNDWVVLDGGYGYGYPYGGDYYGNGYADGPDNNVASASDDHAVSPGGLGAEVQQALDEAGYNAGAADGEIGPQTRNAIAAFQRDNGLPQTGLISQQLLRALGIN